MQDPASDDPLEQFLNERIADQMQKLYESPQAQDPAAFREFLLKESWAMLVRMIHERYDSLWPDSDVFITVMSHILSLPESDTVLLCQAFQRKGWLDSQYQNTARHSEN